MIDDVATTGTTFEVISDVALKQNSISSVSYIVFTRTVKPFVKTKQVDFDYDAFNEYHAYAKKKLL